MDNEHCRALCCKCIGRLATDRFCNLRSLIESILYLIFCGILYLCLCIHLYKIIIFVKTFCKVCCIIMQKWDRGFTKQMPIRLLFTALHHRSVLLLYSFHSTFTLHILCPLAYLGIDRSSLILLTRPNHIILYASSFSVLFRILYVSFYLQPFLWFNIQSCVRLYYPKWPKSVTETSTESTSWQLLPLLSVNTQIFRILSTSTGTYAIFKMYETLFPHINVFVNLIRWRYHILYSTYYYYFTYNKPICKLFNVVSFNELQEDDLKEKAKY